MYVVQYELDRFVYEVDEYYVWEEVVDLAETYSTGVWLVRPEDFTGEYVRELMLREFNRFVPGRDDFELRLTNCFVMEVIEEIKGKEYMYDYDMRLSICLEGEEFTEQRTLGYLGELGLVR